MAKFISDLRLSLQREHLFITSQKQLLGLLVKNVEAKLSNLCLISWFLTYLKENYEKVRNRTIQPIDFVKMIQYKYSLLHADVKLSSEIIYKESPNIILTTLYQEPHIVALLFQQNERADKQEMLARIVYTTLYGGMLTAADEFLYLKVMMELLCFEFSRCKSSFELLQKGSGFKSLFAIYLENSLDAKGFYLTVLQKQVLFLMDEELFLEFEESKAEMHAFQGPGEGEYGIIGNSEEIKLKIKDSAEFMCSLISNLMKSLIQQLTLTPYSVRVLANLLKREISRKWTLPVDAIQGCLANLIFGLFIVPVIADPATFGLVEDSILTDRIRSNLNCMATVLHNLPRIKWRSLSADLKLVFKFTNLDLYFSYIDSFVLDQLSEDGNSCKLDQKASFFYKKLEADRTHFLISKGDLMILQKSISNIQRSSNTTLTKLQDGEMMELSQERVEPSLQTKKKKQSLDKTLSSILVLPKLLMFPIKERILEQPYSIEIKTEEEIMLGKKQVTNLRDISRDNSAIQSALKESYRNDGNLLLTRSAKTRQNSVSGFDTLRREVCHLSSIDGSSEGSSSSEGEEEKSYEGDTSGIGSLANSNSSSYKPTYKVNLKPPLPPYPSTEASLSLNIPHPSMSTQMPSDSDSLEHSDEPVRPQSDESMVRLQRSASMGDNEVWDQDIYQNAEFLRKPDFQKKNNTLVRSPKTSLTLANSNPKTLASSLKSDSTKTFLRSKKLRKNAKNIIKTVSTFGHNQKASKRLDSLSISKSGSTSDFSFLKEGSSTPVKDNEWVKLRSSTFTYMTMKSQQKPLPTSKYFTLLPLDSSSRSFKADMSSIIKRLRLVLSTCSFPDFNIPEPNFLPIEIQQQVSQLALISLSESPRQITMTEEIANKRSLISMLNHEFNMALSRNDIPQIALTSDLLHIVDIMPEIQVGVAIEGIKKEYLARKEYIQYLTLTSLKLSSQQEHINTYEKSILSQVEELEKLFMDTEVRSFLLQNNILFQLDVNLSLTEDKPLTIQNSIYFTLEQMGLDPTWHNWVHHDALLYSIERNVYNHIYYGLFFPKGVEDQDDNELFRIRLDMLSKKLQIEDEFLAINPKYHFSSPWPGALQVLHTINVYRSPRDKLDVITNCCKLITNLLHFADPTGVLGADEILPVLIYVIVNSNPKYLHANTLFLERYSESIEKGENAYWFNQFYIAISNLTSLFKTHGILT